MRASHTQRWSLAVAALAMITLMVSAPVGAGATVAAKKAKVTIGYVVAGDRNDRGFYQGQVEAVLAEAKKLRYKVIVVDKVNPGAAREAFENLCRQNPNLIIGGGSELTDGFVPVSESPECSKITWLLIAGFRPTAKSYATAAANENEAHYMGGYAAGLLLQRLGGNVACVVGGPDLPFVRNMEKNMKDGLKAAAPDKEMIVTLTGDFEDAALATEALKAQIDRGCKLFYPYLGGALPAAVQAAARAGVGVMATSQNLCGVDFLGATVQESILYNPQLYLPALLRAFADGKIKEGKQFALYGVGDYKKLGLKSPDEGVGAVICNPTPQEKEKLDQVRADIASGKIKVGQAA